jgi:hypothetical protein
VNAFTLSAVLLVPCGALAAQEKKDDDSPIFTLTNTVAPATKDKEASTHAFQIGDVGKFQKTNALARATPPFTATDEGLSYVIIRVDNKADELIVQGRVIGKTPRGMGITSEGRPFVLKGVPTKGLKAGSTLAKELEGSFKISDTRKSKQGTVFFVFEAVKEEGGAQRK